MLRANGSVLLASWVVYHHWLHKKQLRAGRVRRDFNASLSNAQHRFRQLLLLMLVAALGCFEQALAQGYRSENVHPDTLSANCSKGTRINFVWNLPNCEPQRAERSSLISVGLNPHASDDDDRSTWAI